MTLKQLQNWVAEDWETRSKKRPSTELQLLYMLEELGEVAECIRKLSGHKDRKQGSLDLGSEMGDLLISLVTLANTFEVDLSTEVSKFQRKLALRQQQGY
jgi:NTP pyrophosphatase (non-canonical NTP hydrolase)